ncbi:MAG: tetratricopeptide repeat protein [Planctomycetota bacterium]
MATYTRLTVLLCCLGLLAAVGCGSKEDPKGAATIALDDEDYGRVIDIIQEEMTDAQRNAADVQTMLGFAHFRRNEFEESKAAYQRASELDPQNPKPLLGVARSDLALAKKATDEPTAERHFLRAADRAEQALGLDDTLAEAHVIQARVHLARGDRKRRADEPEAIQEARELYEQADARFEAAIEQAPENGDWYLERAELLAGRLSKFELALQVIEQALDRAPDLVRARIVKAEVLARMRQMDQAKQELRAAVDSESISAADRVTAMRILSTLYLQTGELDRAKKTARDLVEFDKRNVGFASYILGAVARVEENWEEAYNHLRRLNLKKTRDRRLLMWVALAEQKLGLYQQAMTHYQQILERIDKDYMPARIRLAELLARRGAYDGAMEQCGAVLAERPGQREALLLKAKLHRLRQSSEYDLEKSRSAYMRALAHHPNLVGIHLELAELALQMNEPARAKWHAEVAGRAEDNVGYRLVLGKIHLYLHRAGVRRKTESGLSHLKTAIDNLERAREMSPLHPGVVGALADARIAAEEPAKAVEILKSYVRGNPDQSRGYLMLSRVYEQTGERHKALQTLEDAAEQGKLDERRRVFTALGRAYFNSGRMPDAVKTWSRLDAGMGGPGLGVTAPLAVALALDGREEEALEHARTALYRAKDNRLVAVLAASVAVHVGEHDEARRFLAGLAYPSPKKKQTYQEYPGVCRRAGEKGKQAAGLVAQGISHLLFGTPDTAVPLFQRAAKSLSGSIIPRYLLGTAYREGGRVKDFVRTYEQMARDFPEHGFPYFVLAQAYRQMATLGGDARLAVEKALDRDPKIGPAHILKARLLMNEARGRGGEPALKEAARSAMRAVELDGGTLASLTAAADAYGRLALYWRMKSVRESRPDAKKRFLEVAEKSVENARNLYARLRAEYPDSTAALKGAVRFELSQREFTRAAGLLKGQLAAADDPELFLLAGEAYAGMGGKNLAAARRLLLRAVQLGNDPQAYRRLAVVESRLGRPEQALQVLRRGVQRNLPNIGLEFEYAEWLRNYGRLEAAADTYGDVVRRISPTTENPHLRAMRRRSRIGVAASLLQLAGRAPADQQEELLTRAATRVENLADPPNDDQKPDPSALILLGRIRARQKKVDLAMKSFRQCARLYPDSPVAYHWEAILDYDRGEYGKAADLYANKVIPAAERSNLHPAEWRARLTLAQLATGTPSGLRKARGTADALVRLLEDYRDAGIEPDEQAENRARSAAMLAYVASQLYGNARTQIRRHRGLDSGQMNGYLSLLGECSGNTNKRLRVVSLFGTTLFHENTPRRDTAVKAMEQLTRAFPTNLFLLDKLAGLYLQQARQADYEATLERKLTAADRPGVRIDQADLTASYLRLIDIYRSHAAAGDRDYLDQALRLCNRAIRKLGKTPELLNRKATIQWRQGHPDQAIRTLEDVVGITEKGRNAWIHAKRELASIYYQANRLEKAVEVCNEVDPYVDNDYQWFNETAWYHAVAPDPDLPYALKMALKAKKLAPTDPNVRDTLGWIYYLMEKYYDAELELRYAVAELSDRPNVVYHYGAILYRLGEFDKARENLTRAIRLKREGRPFRYDDECLELLKSIRKD